MHNFILIKEIIISRFIRQDLHMTIKMYIIIQKKIIYGLQKFDFLKDSFSL